MAAGCVSKHVLIHLYDTASSMFRWLMFLLDQPFMLYNIHSIVPWPYTADHGSCSVPGECLCETGYSGTLCDIDEDVCGHQSPCQNGGTCFNSGPDNHYCMCPPTFSGPNCDSDVDECASDPCLNGATCVVSEKLGSSHLPGWMGIH